MQHLVYEFRVRDKGRGLMTVIKSIGFQKARRRGKYKDISTAPLQRTPSILSKKNLVIGWCVERRVSGVEGVIELQG